MKEYSTLWRAPVLKLQHQTAVLTHRKGTLFGDGLTPWQEIQLETSKPCGQDKDRVSRISDQSFWWSNVFFLIRDTKQKNAKQNKKVLWNWTCRKKKRGKCYSSNEVYSYYLDETNVLQYFSYLFTLFFKWKQKQLSIQNGGCCLND